MSMVTTAHENLSPRTEPGPMSPERGPVRRITSRELLGPLGELIIEHGGREYRLRLTQNGRLILTA